ncbi:ABC transporter ATP-binding protein [Nitratireductor kimnyeongensis]|uniref:ABC transporter ATP-binding protein n=1 Tax=Nitratireductor kimnyeongensis TaxID=430679 RepID=A0ABW0T4S5_9HYPH|nr:ABC transporter ATP-binding protein [Nitratireductor kimnyeongensis]QZZ34628.1 ABC transporter ATP-binding protein [Nitratireductor kimnyeongensis]
MLNIEGLGAGYGKMTILHGLSLSLHPRTATVILGPNGVGKTTLCRTVSGLIRATRGRISFEGRDITGASPAARVRAGIVQVPEGRQVFPDLTVRENLRLGAFVHGMPDQDAFDRIYALFPILLQRQSQKAGLLSGGEQQMLALARALMTRPRVLLLDEPSQGLAPMAVELIGHAIKQVAESGVTVLMVEQNLKLAEMVAQRVAIMEHGACTLEGPANEVLSSDAVQNAYLGKKR